MKKKTNSCEFNVDVWYDWCISCWYFMTMVWESADSLDEKLEFNGLVIIKKSYFVQSLEKFFKEFRSASLVYSLSCTVLSFSFQWIWWTVFTLTFFVYLTCIIKQFYIKHEMNQDNYNYFCSVENIHFLLLLTNMADFYKSHKRYRLPERNAWYG